MNRMAEDRRNQQHGRLLRLVNELLLGKEHDRHSAAKVLNATLATADRQLAAIEQHLARVRTRKGPRGRRFSLAAPTNTSGRVPIGAAIAACIGSCIAPLLEGTTYVKGLRDATKRIIADVQRANDFEHFERKFVFHAQGGEASLPERQAELDELIDAVLTSRVVGLEYERFSGTIESLRIKPLSIVLYAHQLYILGEDSSGERHPYRFARVKKVAAGSEKFQYPTKAEYNPSQLWRESIGIFLGDAHPIADVKVLLDPRWRTYANCHFWHASQKVSAAEDGRVLVQLRVRLCPELAIWILSFGEDAEVVAPSSLRETIADRLRNAVGRYTKPAGAQ